MSHTVLIVDDDARLIDLLTEYFGENEFLTHAVMLGADALDAIRDNQPDIVILDIMLPDTNGLEVLKQIRAKHTIPVIMLTAKGDDTDRIVGLELGADDYLPKPFNPRELLARIRAILRRQDRAEPDSDPVVIRTGDLELKQGDTHPDFGRRKRAFIHHGIQCPGGADETPEHSAQPGADYQHGPRSKLYG